MTLEEYEQCAVLIANSHQLRWVSSIRQYVGLCEGVIVSIAASEDSLTFGFYVDLPQWRRMLQNDYAELKQTLNAGVSHEWIYPISNPERIYGCTVVLNGERLESLGAEVVTTLPQVVVDDLHECGARSTQECQQCGQRAATEVLVVNAVLVASCQACTEEVQTQATAGRLRIEQSLRWDLAIPALVGLTLMGAMLWAGLQTLPSFNFYFVLLPIGWAFGLSFWIGRIADGMTTLLRWLLLGSVTLSVLAGNIWGFRVHMLQRLQLEFPGQKFEVAWDDSVRIYFQLLPQIWRTELPYFFGGVIGAWASFRFFKDSETIEVS